MGDADLPRRRRRFNKDEIEYCDAKGERGKGRDVAVQAAQIPGEGRAMAPRVLRVRGIRKRNVASRSGS